MPAQLRTLPRSTPHVVRGAAALATFFSLAAVAVAWSADALLDLVRTPEFVVAPSYGVAAALVATSRSARRMVVLLTTTSLLAGTYTLARAATLSLADEVGAGALETFAGWLTLWAWVPPLGLVVGLLPFVVPEGGLPSRGWRPAVTALLAVVVGACFLAALAPVDLPGNPGVRNPLGVAALAPVLRPAALVLAGAGVALSCLGLGSLVVRFRRADGVERRQVLWFGYAVFLTVAATALAPPWVRALAVLLVPAALVVAVVRYRLFDIDFLINRTVVAVVLLAGAALLHAAVAGWVGSVVGRNGQAASFAAAVAVALAFHPGRVRVQRYADRLLQRDRPTPEAVVYLLDEAVRTAPTPRQAVQDALEVLRSSLRLAGVRLDLAAPSGQAILLSGQETGSSAHSTDLVQHHEHLGTLDVFTNPRHAGLSLQDQQVIEAVTGPLAGAVATVRLTEGLELSRGELVTAQEDERRRLRHDLHDGVGPQLAAVTMTVDAARAALSRGDLDKVDALLASTSEQAAAAVSDVRAVVRGLRPAALDELGLVGALRSAGPAVAAAQGTTVLVEVATEADLGELSAAVEAAAYGIAQEAMTNAVRHGRAKRVSVRLGFADAALRVWVQDDGVGFDAAGTPAGVGLTSMKERATALGGSVEVRSAVGAGTTIVATLPERTRAA